MHCIKGEVNYLVNEHTSGNNLWVYLWFSGCICRYFTDVKLLLLDIQSTDPAWYQLLVSQLTAEHRKDLEEVFRLAEQKKAAAGEQCAMVFNYHYGFSFRYFHCFAALRMRLKVVRDTADCLSGTFSVLKVTD